MAAAGLAGTPIGGALLDYTLKRRTAPKEKGPEASVDLRGLKGGDMGSYMNSAVLSGQLNLAGVLFVFGCVLAKPKGLFFGLFAVAGALQACAYTLVFPNGKVLCRGLPGPSRDSFPRAAMLHATRAQAPFCSRPRRA